MTKSEAEQALRTLDAEIDKGRWIATHSTGHYIIPEKVYDDADQARFVLGQHTYQRSFEYVSFKYPGITKAQYLAKRKALFARYQ